MDCLNGIIGLSRKDCECFEDDKPEGANESLSGLYLDELPGISLKKVDGSKDCGEGSVWNRMDVAVNEAEIELRAELLSLLNKRFKDAYTPFSGIVGLRKFNSSISNLKDVQGVNLEVNAAKGAIFLLKEIDAYFTETTVGEIEVSIYRSDSDDPLYQIIIDTEANKVKKNILETAIELPLYVDGYDDLEYHFVYSKHPTAKPLNNKFLSCSCKRTSAAWSQFGYFGGINTGSFTSVQELDDVGIDNFMYGLGLIGQMKCQKSHIICEPGVIIDFQNDETALNIAMALRYKAGIVLIQGLIDRPDSSIVALDVENLVFLANSYEEKYKNIISYLSVIIDPKNDCFVCNNQMNVTPIES